MTEAGNGNHRDDRASKRPPARVDSSTRVNVAFPFSQVKIQEPSDHLLSLTELVAELAGLVADAMPGPQSEAVHRRARELAGQIR